MVMNNIDKTFIKCIEGLKFDAAIKLLKAGANARANDDHALQLCAKYGHTDMVAMLLGYGANPHANDDYALRWSAAHGHLNIVIALIKCGANVNAQSKIISDARSPLLASIARGHLDIVTKLLEHGVDIRANNDYALQSSVTCSRYEIMEKLLEHGANIYCRDKELLSQLQFPMLFHERVADIILPYCDTSDYEYFPQDYIKRKIIPIKSANT